ncbi:MAG TPA: hypothetical protein VM122_02900 [Usitatibacter sp.]|nr:hypothetical protein [Usitatibacter sp.]
MSAEFRRRRGHLNCRMPMVMLSHRVAPDSPNWTIESSQTACSHCMPLVMAIVDEAGHQFDLRDPTAMPKWPATSPRPSAQPTAR